TLFPYTTLFRSVGAQVTTRLAGQGKVDFQAKGARAAPGSMIDHEAAFSLRAVLFRSARSLASSSDLHSAAFAGSRPFVRHAFRSVRTIRRRGATRSPWKRTGEESRVRLARKSAG